MRITLAAFALALLLPAPAGASFDCPAHFIYPHVVYHAGDLLNGQILDAEALLREKGVALLLEEYVAGKIARGELADKRLHVGDRGRWSWPLRVSQNRASFFIDGVRGLDVRQVQVEQMFWQNPDRQTLGVVVLEGG